MIKTIRVVAGAVLLLSGAAARGGEERRLAVELTVPDSAWTIAIEGVYRADEAIWVVSRVSQDSDILGAQVISTVRDAVTVVAPDLPVRHVVIGRTWHWDNEEPYRFVDDRRDVAEILETAESLYEGGE